VIQAKQHVRPMRGGAQSHLVEELIKVRSVVRDLIEMFRTSSREPFPQWEIRSSEVMSHSQSVK